MKTRLLVAAANVGFMFLLVAGVAAEAAEIKVLSTLAMQSVMEDLGPKFERATGHKLAITFATSGAIASRVQGGDAEIAVHTFQLLIPVAGIEIVGPLPGDLQDANVFAAAITAGARDAEASKALVSFLRTPEATAVIKAKGMDPTTP